MTPKTASDPPPIERLRQVWRQACDRWPGVALSLEDFAGFLAARGLSPEDCSREAGPALPFEDLYLACACARGDPRAAASFEAALGPEIDAAVARTSDPALRQDIRQAVLAKLLVGDGARPPKIGQYAGEGGLRAWVRVVALRQAINAVRDGPAEVCREAGGLEEALFDPGLTPEMDLLKNRCRQELKQLVGGLLEALSARDRNLLKLYFLDGLSLEEIGSLYGVHQSTVSRWLAKIHKGLRAGIGKLSRRELGLSPRDLASLLDLIHSQLDLSLERVLRESRSQSRLDR